MRYTNINCQLNFFLLSFAVSEHEITLDAFLCMTEATLSVVIPKAGPRAVVLSKIHWVI
jgi:hypothetical protein